MLNTGVLRAVASGSVAGVLAVGLGACGSKKMQAAPVDPVTMALTAPGVRSVLVPRQHASLIIVVPPCGLAKVKQETTRTPPGSNQVVVPKSALDQTVAIQPCVQGAQARGSTTVLLSPGGAGSAESGQQKQPPPNQLILPRKSNIRKLIVPPCLVVTGTSGVGGPSGGPNVVLPATRGKTAVTAPPCTVQMTTSSSS